MRVVLCTGKGGVGKTTTSAATAVHAAEAGLRSIVVSADPAHGLGDVLEVRLGGRPTRLGGRPTRLAPRLHALEIDTRDEVHRHWGAARDYLVELFASQGVEEVVAEELALLPGAEEIAALLAVDALARSSEYDLIVVDCAPTDATLRLVSLPDVMRGAVRVVLKLQRAVSALVKPLFGEAAGMPLPEPRVFAELEQLLYGTLRRLGALLAAESTSIRIVVTPERMVIDEARRAFTQLTLFGLGCDAVVMNRLLPEAAAREAFFEDWGRVQAERVQEVETLFAPVRVLSAPLQEDEVTGLEALSRLGALLYADCDPAACLSEPRRIRFAKRAEGYRIHLPLPAAEGQALDVVKVEDELVVRAGASRRALKLTPRMAACTVTVARFVGDELLVDLDRVAGASGDPPPRADVGG